MAALKSFISERTAEYIIVPDLCRQLEPTFRRILPFFFWSTREGNSVSRVQMQNATVRVLTVFARRPKIATATAGEMSMKLNESIVEYAHDSFRRGIPVIAAMPLASSLDALHTHTECIYLDLHAQPSGADILIDTERLGGSSNALSAEELVQLLHASQQLSWEHITEVLQAVRAAHLKHQFPFFAGYRPFHLAVR